MQGSKASSPATQTEPVVSEARHKMIWGSMADTVPLGQEPNHERAALLAGYATAGALNEGLTTASLPKIIPDPSEK